MGKLILLNTPIGNLDDITTRVKRAYIDGTTFVAEDTRNFKTLLNHLGISLVNKTFISFHEHSQDEQVDHILSLVNHGDVYVVSDAGSPAISDPAFPLVARAYEQGIEVDSLSGVSALTMALELAGLPPIPTTFVGFLPREKAKIINLFQKTREQGGTFIFFESPKRVVKTLTMLLEECAEQVSFRVMRELSKQFQAVVTINSLSDLTKIEPRGEFVIAYHIPAGAQVTTAFQKKLEIFLEGKKSKKDLAKFLSEYSTYSTKELYKLLN